MVRRVSDGSFKHCLKGLCQGLSTRSQDCLKGFLLNGFLTGDVLSGSFAGGFQGRFERFK